MTNITWPARCILALLLLILVFLAYQPGLTGALYYDDYSNLDMLESIESATDAKEFVLGGQAGPLGRPIALLSFLPNAQEWPDNSVEILHINVLIHVANALILLCLAYMLMRLSTALCSSKSYIVALSAVALWALLPLNVSASLIAVQRMTTLSALFGLAGLCGFIAGYFIQQQRPVLAIMIQGAALGAGTLLAIFSKENGALIPVFALVIHATLLKDIPIQRQCAMVRSALLWLALLAILIYLSPIMRDWFAFNEYRGASAWARFLSQPGILLQYLVLAFAPLPTQFSPFHDDIRLTTEAAAIVIPVLIWISLAVISVKTHRISPWPLFALLWFLTGHLLESSVIHLELFFEHRNYVALFGVCLATSYFAWNAPAGLSRVIPVLFVGYIAVIATILVATTSLWGSPLLAAETWAVSKPASARAALHLATLDIEEAGGSGSDAQRSLVSAAKRDRAVLFMDNTIAACPECIDVHMQALLYSCDIKKNTELKARLGAILEASRDGKSTLPVVDGVFPLIQLAKQGLCGPISIEDVKKLVDNLIANPAFSSQMYLTRLYFQGASIAYEKNELDDAKKYLENAEGVGPQALPVLQFQVHVALQQGLKREAIAAIDRRRALANDSYKMNHAVLNDLQNMVIESSNIGSNK